MRYIIIKPLASLLTLGLLTACVSPVKAPETVDASAVIHHYADLAEAKYTDSLTTAKALDTAIQQLLAQPDAATLTQARTAWLAARVPYQQTEVYRFGNAIVDDWEGRVNAWPLDEGLIDYVDASYGTDSDENSLYTANVIANTSLLVDGRRLDTSKITPELIANQLQEAGGIEANVASGYHAIEFLLWGQDLNGTQAGAGNRPYTDYSLQNCTHGHCERRRAYLAATSQLLVSDLAEMVANWETDGAARQALLKGGTQNALRTILIGMGSLSYGELAGERMKLGLLLGDPEEEHDCFADNTHNSHYYDTVGIRNVYLGTYTRTDGSELSGPAIADLVAMKDAAVDAELKADLQVTEGAMQQLVRRAENTEAYDQMIATGNTAGNAVVQRAIDALVDQTASIERAIAVLQLGNIALEGSDSLDNPNAIFQ
ncbi:MAG: imelysin family protein [Pseudomonadota bacterium]